MKKRAVSQVIATVLIILLTIVAISILWFVVLPMLNKVSLFGEKVSLEILSEGYTAWDSDNRLAEIQIKRGVDDAKIVGFKLIFELENDNLYYIVDEVINFNEKKVYNFNFTNYSSYGELLVVKLVAIYENGKESRVLSELRIRETPKKDLSSKNPSGGYISPSPSGSPSGGGAGGGSGGGTSGDEEKICDLTNAYWNTSSVIEGRTVRLNVEGNYCQNKLVNYTIIRQGELSWNPFRWFSQIVFSGTSTTSMNWVAGQRQDEVIQTGTYFFKATLSENTSEEIISVNLIVESSACVPESPSATCGSRVCGTRTNNCGEQINCGTCGSGDECDSSGQCIEKPVTPTPSTTCEVDFDCSGNGPGFFCNQEKICEWLPPIGIPVPEFGIYETYRMYDEPENRNTDLTYHQNSEGGFYTHYVDNTDPSCTNTNNNGTIENPRCSIPTAYTIIPEGSVIEVHGGPYQASFIRAMGNGTRERPIFVRGLNYQEKPVFTTALNIFSENVAFESKYMIFENLNLTNGFAFRGNTLSNVSYGVIRNSYSTNTIGVTYCRNCVVYNNVIRPGPEDLMDLPSFNELDRMGVAMGSNTDKVWVLDSHIYRGSGDAIGNAHGAKYTASNWYIGRNLMHNWGENAVDIKEAENVTISQNIMYNFFGQSSGDAGLATVVHYGPQLSPKNVWFIFNEVYNAVSTAMQIGGDQAYDVYYIGNIIHDIKNEAGTAKAFQSWNSRVIYVVGNTIYNVDEGIVFDSQSTLSKAYIHNNIIYLSEGSGNHLYLSGSNYVKNASIENNLFYKENGDLQIRWGGATYNDMSSFQTATGKCSGCINANPLFVDAPNLNFSLQPSSPAIDSSDNNLIESLNNLYHSLWGVDISVDYNNLPRPQGAGWDIGAYEYAESPKVIYVDNQLTADCKETYSIANRNCNGGDGDAYNTPQKALNIVEPGNKIIILGDVNKSSDKAIYNVSCNGINLVNSGTPQNRITIESYPNHYVKIHGTGAEGCDGIEFDGGGANYYTIRGLHFDNFNKATEGSVNIRKEGLIIEKCEFSNFADRGIILRNVHNSIFKDLYIHHSYEAGFVTYAPANNLTLINVESSYNNDGKGSEGDADGFALGDGTGNITLINCTAIDNGEDGIDITGENVQLINFYTSGGNACGIKLWRRTTTSYSNYTLINTVVEGYNEAGIKITGGSTSPQGEYHVHIYNSLFYNNGENGLVLNFGREDISASAEIYNSLFIKNGYFNPNDNSCCYPAFSVSSSIAPYWNITSDYNLFYDNWDNDTAWSGEGINSLKGINPKLFSPESGDFHLTGNSPLIDTGKTISAVNFDFDGKNRPVDGNNDGSSIIDIGPFESYQKPGNQGPSFSYSGATNFQINEGQELFVTFPAVDPEGDSLRYLLFTGDILPEMKIDNEGKFTFTPNYDRATSSQEGSYELTIAVTDENYYYPPATLNISIKVNDINRPPVYEGLNYYTFIEGRNSRLRFPVTDLDGEITMTSTISNLPQSANYDNSKFIIDWTPSNEDIGKNIIELEFSDGIDTSKNTIILEVLPKTPYQEPSEENTFYVDGNNGLDTNDGQTSQTSWKTIQKAKNTLNAGQMVLIHEGMYNEYGSLTKSGTPEAPIIFKNYPEEKVVMEGSSFSSPEAFNFGGGVSNIIIDGIEMANFGETIYFRGSNENVTLLNLNIYGADYGIYGSANNIRIENVTVTNISDRGIYVGKNAHIYNVSISDYEDRGITAYSEEIDNVNILNSKIRNSRSMGTYGILAGGKNVYMSNVELLNNSGSSVSSDTDYIYIKNTIIAKTRPRSGTAIGLRISTEEDGYFELYNNIFYESAIYEIYFGNLLEGLLRNNIIYSNNTRIRGTLLNEDYNLFGDGFPPVGSHSFNADPLFTNPENNDFSLQLESPAIDAGIDIGLPYSGNAPDIGSYEYETENPETTFFSLLINQIKELFS
ncbi:MAG: right-handed parallel beta-helix repeat-containing protein [Candidatus Pacearchaeota archaeon]